MPPIGLCGLMVWFSSEERKKMSEQQSSLTYEGILELFRMLGEETDRRMKETNQIIQETAEQMKETDRRMKESERKISALGSRIGEIIENMVSGNIVAKFREFGYAVNECSQNKYFENKELGISGEIDVLLEDGDIAILIEVKTTLVIADVREHIERLEKYRCHTDTKVNGDKRRFIGAVAGAVVRDDAAKFAQKNGMYVIVQSGEAVKIVPPPEGFVAKEW